MHHCSASSQSIPLSSRLSLERLEEREVPAINIFVDYSFDLRANGGSGFFEDNPAARVVMNQVAREMGQRIAANLSAVSPSGTNTWSATFFHPLTGNQVAVHNLSVPSNTLIVYVGGRVMPGPAAGIGGYGGYSWSGTAAWGNTVASRGWSGFAPWGGSIAFDTTENWHFGLTTEGLDRHELDFYTVALHELGHLLGVGTAPQWNNRIRGGFFVGTNATSVYGGSVPAPNGHWAENLSVGGQVTVMSPVINYGERRTWTSLDQAALRDIGWQSGSLTTPPISPPVVPSPPSPPVPPPPPPVAHPPVGSPSRPPVLISAPDGRVDVYVGTSDGNLVATGQSFTPFPGFLGPIRTAVADFNGDRIPDYAFVTGAGTTAQARLINGATGQDLAVPTVLFGGFGGGVFVAAGDVDRDGRAELVVSADAGGLPAVEVYRVDGGHLTLVSSFLALSPSNDRGIRVAMGDVNRDGVADLVIGSGRGSLPRVLVVDGQGLLAGRRDLLVPAFLGFSRGARAGVNVTTGDLDGDGYCEVVVSQEQHGNSRVRIWSGARLTAQPTVPPDSYPPWQDFFANGTESRGGIRAVARDLDGNGVDELVTSAADASGWVRVLSVSRGEVRAFAPIFPNNGLGSLASAAAGSLGTDPAAAAERFHDSLPPGGPCLCCVANLHRPLCSRVAR
jgi:hypothetical protein